MNLARIHDAIRSNRIRITNHATDEAEDDDLLLDEILASVLIGELIEQYPNDRPYPSCLIYGVDTTGDAIHSVWAYNEDTEWAVLITVYRPDPARWIDGRMRRK